jgi:prepilin-type N-terminal cleavage/methylation domain-containing protein/prepilin-type processing-associated H-X9-DG protein
MRYFKNAFTLIELLIVIAIIGVLSALFLPALSSAKAKAQQIECISNEKQIVLGCNVWSIQNDGRYPWMLSVDEMGTPIFYFDAVNQFLNIKNEFATPKLMVCPSDKEQSPRPTWDDFSMLGDLGLSYFAGCCANERYPMTMLTGDRNMNNLSPMSLCSNTVGNYTVGVQSISSWQTTNIHRGKGNIGLADGSAHQMNNLKLQNSALAGITPVCDKNHILQPCPQCIVTH